MIRKSGYRFSERSYTSQKLAGVTRFDLSRVYRAPRRPVVVPVERWPRAARERFARPRAGTALAPHLDRIRNAPFGERDSIAVCNGNGDGCQGIVSENDPLSLVTAVLVVACRPGGSNHGGELNRVMAGLVPAIPIHLSPQCPHKRDRRHKAGDDAVGMPCAPEIQERAGIIPSARPDRRRSLAGRRARRRACRSSGGGRGSARKCGRRARTPPPCRARPAPW
jgi:hypothetical protein